MARTEVARVESPLGPGAEDPKVFEPSAGFFIDLRVMGVHTTLPRPIAEESWKMEGARINNHGNRW